MLSGSFFFTVGILAYLLFQSTSARIEKVRLDTALGNPFVIPFAIIAISAAVASFFVSKLLVRGTELLPDQERRQKRFTSFIISMAMAEMPAVLGFIVGNSSESFEIALPLFALSFVVMVFHWIKIQSIE